MAWRGAGGILFGWAAFAGSHVAITQPSVRESLIEKLGGEAEYSKATALLAGLTLGPTAIMYSFANKPGTPILFMRRGRFATEVASILFKGVNIFLLPQVFFPPLYRKLQGSLPATDAKVKQASDDDTLEGRFKSSFRKLSRKVSDAITTPEPIEEAGEAYDGTFKGRFKSIFRELSRERSDDITALEPVEDVLQADASDAGHIDGKKLTSNKDIGIEGLQRITRHPMFVYFALYGLGKAWIIRTAPALAFYGGFPLFAIAGILHQEMRMTQELPPWYLHQTSVLPFKAIVEGRNVLPEPQELSVFGLLLSVGWLTGFRIYKPLLSLPLAALSILGELQA
eukprot:Colp12_sorted_trinity150504_noHs@490